MGIHAVGYRWPFCQIMADTGVKVCFRVDITKWDIISNINKVSPTPIFPYFPHFFQLYPNLAFALGLSQIKHYLSTKMLIYKAIELIKSIFYLAVMIIFNIGSSKSQKKRVKWTKRGSKAQKIIIF